jgi:hypothetical protein
VIFLGTFRIQHVSIYNGDFHTQKRRTVSRICGFCRESNILQFTVMQCLHHPYFGTAHNYTLFFYHFFLPHSPSLFFWQTPISMYSMHWVQSCHARSSVLSLE